MIIVRPSTTLATIGTVTVSSPYLVYSSISAAIGAATSEKINAVDVESSDIRRSVKKVKIKEVIPMATLPYTDLTPSIHFPESLCLPKFRPTMAAAASPGPYAIIEAAAL